MEFDSKTISRVEGGLEGFVGESNDAGKSDQHENLTQIAQADTGQADAGQAGGGLGVEQAQPGDFDPGTVTQTFAVIDGQAVVLPADTVISRILVSGTDLVIIAADGSVFLIENGAQTPPTLVIDGLTIPSTALAQAITSGAEIQPAAGPEGGSGTPGAPGSSGNNFGELEIGDIGDGAGFGGLLEGLGLFFTGPGGDEPRDELPIEPVVLADDGDVPVSAVLVEEDDLLGVIPVFAGFGGFENGYSFWGFEGGSIHQYDPDHVIWQLDNLGDTFHEFFEGAGLYFDDLSFPATVGNLGGITLFNYDFSFLEKFGGLGNDEDGSRFSNPNGLQATGSFNLGPGTFEIEFDKAAIDVLNTGLTSNGEPVLFEISSDGETLYAYTVQQLEGLYRGPVPVNLNHVEAAFAIDVQDKEQRQSISDGVVVRPIFEININENVEDGEYTVRLYNNLDHLPTVQGEEILPFNFPFIAENIVTGATESGVFQVQFQDDEPVLLRDVLEEFYNAFAVIVDLEPGEQADLSGFGWGIETIFSEVFGFFGSGFLENLPFGDIRFEEIPSFDQVYAFAQFFLGLEHGTVDESLLDNLDRDVHLADLDLNIGGIDNADNVEGSLGSHAGYQDEYVAFFEHLFSHDHSHEPDWGEYGEPNREFGTVSDGAVTTYGLLGALFGADAGEARSITFSSETVAVAGGVQLTSKGEDISYTISEDGTLLQAFASSGDEDEPRLVFEAELTDQIIGAFRFTLFDQIDHAEGIDGENLPENGFEAGVNDLFATLEFLYDVTDSDGDTATGSFFVDVLDDEPYEYEYADDGDGGAGKQDYAAPLYGHHGNKIADTVILEHVADQQLTGRFFVGADEPGNIAFGFTADDLGNPENDGFPEELPQSFNGLAMAYSLSPDGRTLTARYAGLETESESDTETESVNESDGIVFTLTLNPSNLTYTFDLVLGSPPSVTNRETSEAWQDQFSLFYFSVPITGSDFDGDSFEDRISIRTLSEEYFAKGFKEEAGSALFEGGGSVFFEGTEYNDSILGSPTKDTFVYAGDGDDLIIAGGAGYNHFHGDDGDDIIIGGNYIDDLYGDDGNDLLIGGDGEDNLYGGDGDDILRGGNHYDELYGGLGNDDLRGGRGDDVLRGGRGDDELRGGRGEDELHGGRGDDDLRGGRHDDDLRGGRGDDELRGGRGNDDLRGGRGDDFMDGGRGDDTAIYKGASENYAIGVARDDDGNVIGLTVTALSGPDGTDTLVDIEEIRFESDNKTFDLTDPILLLDEDGALVGTYSTIQSAVDDANTDFTVLVAPGTYNENVVIDQSIRLLSIEGRDSTFIDGVQAGSQLGAIEIDPDVNDVTIGDIGHGFTIRGIDGPPAIEKAAIYLQGNQNYISIRGNDLVARGDSAVTSEYGAAVTHLIIAYNIISGQTFTGDNPAGTGFGQQFIIENVPRQLVVLGNGDNAAPSSNNIYFTNNEITGTAGGISTDDNVTPQGNTLVTIDAADSVISDNTFSGSTTGSGVAIRARGSNTDVENNTLDHTGGGDSRGIFIKDQGVPADYDGNVLNGGPGDEVIFSMTPGDDVLNGNGGNDVLAGGAGNNELTGGADSDVFLFTPDALDNLADQVLDYSLAEGDQVDLTTLFDVGGGDVADFVQYDDTTGVLSVDADGGGAGVSEVVATFTNTPVDIEVLFTDSATPGDDTTIV